MKTPDEASASPAMMTAQRMHQGQQQAQHGESQADARRGSHAVSVQPASRQRRDDQAQQVNEEHAAQLRELRW